MSVLLAHRPDWEDLEINLLLEGVYQRYGFDFRDYARVPLKEKLHAFLRTHGITTISALQDKIIHDSHMGEIFLCELHAHSGTLFEAPEQLRQLRDIAIPWLRSHPSPKIWIAECVSSEEACTLAILLDEEGLYDKTQIFATSANESLLQRASTAGVELQRLSECEESHLRSGGKKPLSNYFTVSSERALLSPRLRANITWAQFNLQTDASFNEFQLIICRRVLSDFSLPLQRRILHLFHDSLPVFGLMNIDNSREIEPHPISNWYKQISSTGSLFKRIA